MTEKECDNLLLNLRQTKPVYVWGANLGQHTSDPDTFEKLYKKYGDDKQYTRDYYQRKLRESQGKQISDCSGMIYAISKKDNTAKGYYAACPEKGKIDSIDKSHSCLVFRGSSPSGIHHIGYYCASTGEVLEMENSQTNFQCRKFDAKKWNYWGKPSFIDYNKKSGGWPKKGVDLSVYNNITSYTNLKAAGVQFVVLKGIDKSKNVEPGFTKHYNGANNAGIEVVGAYCYSYAQNTADAKAEANALLKAVKNKKVPTLILDVEDNCQKELGETLVDIILTFKKTVEDAGYSFVLYTGLNFYNTKLKTFVNRLTGIKMWIARYPSTEQMGFAQDPNPEKKPSVTNLAMWQYASSVVIPEACSGKLDCNLMYTPLDGGVKTAKIAGPIDVGYVTTTSGSLRVRDMPNINGKIVGYLVNGTRVVVYDSDPYTGWLRISEHESRWVSNEYITK